MYLSKKNCLGDYIAIGFATSIISARDFLGKSSNEESTMRILLVALLLAVVAVASISAEQFSFEK